MYLFVYYVLLKYDTGLECVFQAIQSEKNVIGLARNVSKLVVPVGSGNDAVGKAYDDGNSFLQIVQGSVLNPDDVDKVFELADDISGVVVVLGGRTKDVGLSMLTDGTTNIINSMLRHGVKRISIVTSIGCGDSISQAPLKFKILMWTVMRNIMKDKNNQEQLFLSEGGVGKDLE